MEINNTTKVGEEIAEVMDTVERSENFTEIDCKFDDTLVDNEYLAICNSTGAEVHVFDHDVDETYKEGYKDGKTSGEKIAVVGIAAAVGAVFAIKKGIKWFKNRKAKEEIIVEEVEDVIIEPEKD